MLIKQNERNVEKIKIPINILFADKLIMSLWKRLHVILKNGKKMNNRSKFGKSTSIFGKGMSILRNNIFM